MFKNTAGFDITTVVYIVLAIVAFVSSVIQKKKQQKQEAVPENKEPGWKDLFDDPEPVQEPEPIREVYRAPKNEYKQEPVKKEAYLSTEERLFRSKSSESYIENEASVINSIGKSYEYEDVIKQTEIKETEEKQSVAAFNIDLQKAIIYSEIIQRKY